jgi:tetratricopeptide (TPR) repeat protein
VKWIPLLLVFTLAALATTVWLRLRPLDLPLPTAEEAREVGRDGDARHQALHTARRSCRVEALDQFLSEQRRLVQQSPTDAGAVHVLAEALLERVLLRNLRRGMAVGEALYAELPPATASDLDEGLRLIRRARQLGDESSENYRLEASMLGNQITGLGAALQLTAPIQAALAKASELDRNNPHLHVTIGLRQLLAPRFLGQDPGGALEHLEFAARSLPDDERPGVFAAMAAHLLRQREKALMWLDSAVQKNPENVFARVVLQRLRRGEDAPFARDVTATEVSTAASATGSSATAAGATAADAAK